MGGRAPSIRHPWPVAVIGVIAVIVLAGTPTRVDVQLRSVTMQGTIGPCAPATTTATIG
jgi:hypothetical protein